jgi:hypothetical protein
MLCSLMCGFLSTKEYTAVCRKLFYGNMCIYQTMQHISGHNNFLTVAKWVPIMMTDTEFITNTLYIILYVKSYDSRCKNTFLCITCQKAPLTHQSHAHKQVHVWTSYFFATYMYRSFTNTNFLVCQLNIIYFCSEVWQCCGIIHNSFKTNNIFTRLLYIHDLIAHTHVTTLLI